MSKVRRERSVWLALADQLAVQAPEEHRQAVASSSQVRLQGPLPATTHVASTQSRCIEEAVQLVGRASPVHKHCREIPVPEREVSWTSHQRRYDGKWTTVHAPARSSGTAWFVGAVLLQD